MAFLVGALAGAAGAADERKKQYDDALARASDFARLREQQRQFDESQRASQADRDETKRMDDASIARTNAQTAFENNRVSLADRQNGVGLKIPPQYIPPHNATPEERARKQLLLADWYEQQGATALATQTRANALAFGTSSLHFAQAAEVANRPKELQEKIVAAQHLLETRLGAQAANIQAQIAGRLNVAEFNAQARRDIAAMTAAEALRRVEVAQGGADRRNAATIAGADRRNAATIAGANARNAANVTAGNERNAANIAAGNARVDLEAEVRKYGIDLNAITREQATIYTQQMENARASMRQNAQPFTGTMPQFGMQDPPPGSPPGTAPAPIVNNFIGGGGGGGGWSFAPLPTTPNAGAYSTPATATAPAPAAPAAADAPSAGPPPNAAPTPLPKGGFASVIGARPAAPPAPAARGARATEDPKVQETVTFALDAIKNHGMKVDDIRAKLPSLGLSPQQQAEVLRRLQQGAAPLAPLPVSTGGGAAPAGPFSLR